MRSSAQASTWCVTLIYIKRVRVAFMRHTYTHAFYFLERYSVCLSVFLPSQRVSSRCCDLWQFHHAGATATPAQTIHGICVYLMCFDQAEPQHAPEQNSKAHNSARAKTVCDFSFPPVVRQTQPRARPRSPSPSHTHRYIEI